MFLIWEKILRFHWTLLLGLHETKILWTNPYIRNPRVYNLTFHRLLVYFYTQLKSPCTFNLSLSNDII